MQSLSTSLLLMRVPARRCAVSTLFHPSSQAHACLSPLPEQMRRAGVCGRCHTIMYPGPIGSRQNHKRGYCSDGVQSKSTVEQLPDWPQPAGIFVNGTHFDPLAFLTTLRAVYEKVVMEGVGIDNLIEYSAFVRLLIARTVTFDEGIIAFRLFDLQLLKSLPPSWLFERDGVRCLRLDCLGGD
jgi:hypothetical protein